MQSIAGSRDTGDFPCPCNQQKVKVLQPSLSKIRQNNHNLHLPLKAHRAKQIWCPPARKQAISKTILLDHQNFTHSLVFEPHVAQINEHSDNRHKELLERYSLREQNKYILQG